MVRKEEIPVSKDKFHLKTRKNRVSKHAFQCAEDYIAKYWISYYLLCSSLSMCGLQPSFVVFSVVRWAFSSWTPPPRTRHAGRRAEPAKNHTGRRAAQQTAGWGSGTSRYESVQSPPGCESKLHPCCKEPWVQPERRWPPPTVQQEQRNKETYKSLEPFYFSHMQQL